MADSEYEQARARARARQGALEEYQVRRIIAALRDFVSSITAKLVGLWRDPESTRAYEQTQRLARQEADQLSAALNKSIARGRKLSFEDISTIWDRAGFDYARTRGSTVRVSQLRAPALSIVSSFESEAYAATWKSLIRRYAADGALEVTAIARMAFIEGINPDEFARRLRRYVVGAEPFELLFHGDRIDLRSIPANLRGAARQMRFNSERIAFSQIQDSRVEAEVNHFILDPFVGAVLWTLSPNRGSLTSPDECDLLATGDFYGLGAGTYPVLKVPYSPHPFDRCERLPVTRPFAQIEDPKPNPSLVSSPLSSNVPFPRGARITAHAADRARKSAHAALGENVG